MWDVGMTNDEGDGAEDKNGPGHPLSITACHPERSESASAAEGSSGRRQPTVTFKGDAALAKDLLPPAAEDPSTSLADSLRSG